MWLILRPYLSTGGAQGAVGGDGHCVQVAGVTDVVGLQLAVGQVPHLDTRAPTLAPRYATTPLSSGVSCPHTL